MLTHVVLFTFNDRSDIPDALERLRDLPSQIPSLISLRCGVNSIDGPNACDVALITEHADVDGLNQYVEHHVHQEVVAWLSSRLAARAVVDSVDFR